MIVLMGTAGAGKGTQGALLKSKTGYDYVSTGEMLREFASDDQRERMLLGDLLTDDEIIGIVEQALASIPNVENVIFDGFPRNLAQAEWLIARVKTGHVSMPQVINLDVDENTVHTRLLRRGRQDDSETVISRRFQLYQTVTLPVLGLFRDSGATVYDIDADQSPEAVQHDIVAALDGTLTQK